MAKRGIKKVFRSNFSQKSSGNSLQLDGVTVSDMGQVCLTATDEFKIGLIKTMMAAFVVIVIMIQLRLSQPTLDAQYFDKLPSYKHYKGNGVQGVLGRTVAFLFAAFKTLAVIPNFSQETISDLAIAYVEVPIPNSRRLGSPTAGNWQQYLNGELSAAMGMLLSCPSTNIRCFGMDPKWIKEATVEVVMKRLISSLTILPEFKEIAASIKTEEVIDLVKDNILEDSGGIPRTSLVFAEPGNVSSKVEAEIFGSIISRDGTVNDVLVSGGNIPDSAITGEMVVKHLTPAERLQYNAAKKQGLTDVLKTLNGRIRSREREEAKKTSSSSDSTPEKESNSSTRSVES